MAKTHQITSYDGSGKAFTECGREGWKTAMTDEFETAYGDRFEAVEKRSKVTCKSCLNAIERRNRK